MSKIRIYLDAPEYVIRLEDEQGRLFVHLDVFKWDKTIKRELEEEFVNLKEKATKAGYSFIHTYTRNPKFCKVMGGSKTMDFRDYEVWSWGLE
jgi:hypothetical protein